MHIAGIILAGGQSRRMNGRDKALLPFGAARLIDHIHARLSRQTGSVALNSNADPAHFSALGSPVIADDIDGFAGPLAGVLAGMEWAARCQPAFSHIATVATDTPFFPADLVETLRRSIDGAPRHIGLAASAGRIHPVFGLWPIALRHELRAWLADGSNRRVMTFIEAHTHRIAQFSLVTAQTGLPLDPFFNINTPQDIDEARSRWSAP